MPSIPLDYTQHTSRLRLRSPALNDAAFIYSAAQYAGFIETMDWVLPAGLHDVEQSLKDNIQGWKLGSEYLFTIENSETKQAVGRVALIYDDWPPMWNLGFWIHPEYWGQGYATEAAQAAIGFAFNQLGIQRIVTDHVVDNSKSQRVIQKLGFQFTKENRFGWKKNGQHSHLFIYELVNDSSEAGVIR